MGQVSSSTAVNTSVIEAITNVLIANSQECTAAANTSQSITTGLAGNDATVIGNKQTSGLNINLTCLSTVTNDATLQNKIAQAITQKLSSANSGVAFGLSSASSTAVSTSIQKIASTVDISNIQTCALRTIQSQSIDVAGATHNILISGNEQTISATLLGNCISNNSNTVSAINDLSQVIDQQATATNTGLTFAIIGTIIVVIIILVVSKSGSNKSKSQ